jgi:hypothetical protein
MTNEIFSEYIKCIISICIDFLMHKISNEHAIMTIKLLVEKLENDIRGNEKI